MALSRRITNRINWLLDNCLPPVIRDSPLLMKPTFYALFGRKGYLYANFKQEIPGLTRAKYAWYYRELADTFLKRDTDLSVSSIERITLSVTGTSVLDVACGRGFLSQTLSSHPALRVVGADLCAAPGVAGSKAFSFVQSDIEHLPFRNNSFDTVISAHTLEHVLDFDSAVRELRRVARRRLIVVVPRQREFRFTFDLHVRFFPYPFSLRKAMSCNRSEVYVIENDMCYIEDKTPDEDLSSGS